MITISPLAQEKIEEMIAQQENPNLLLRISVSEGGCSGFSYVMSLSEKEEVQDQLVEIGHLHVLVDKESIVYINGLEIDYKESGMSGGFTLHNPNASATCGCGSSFRTKKYAGKAEKC